jgi:predicted nuclease of restriction endonuclease-like (RecB) superfamily
VLAASLIILMMKAASTSETSVYFYQTTWCYNPEDNHLNIEVNWCNPLLNSKYNFMDWTHIFQKLGHRITTFTIYADTFKLEYLGLQSNFLNAQH